MEPRREWDRWQRPGYSIADLENSARDKRIISKVRMRVIGKTFRITGLSGITAT